MPVRSSFGNGERGGDESEGRRKGEMTLRLTFSALSTSVVVAEGFRTFFEIIDRLVRRKRG